jgi:dihydroorotate dehydrogenase
LCPEFNPNPESRLTARSVAVVGQHQRNSPTPPSLTTKISTPRSFALFEPLSAGSAQRSLLTMAVPYSRARNPLSTGLRPLTTLQRPAAASGISLSRRLASTSSSTSPTTSRLKAIAIGTSLTLSAGLIYYYATDTRASIHQWAIPPLLRALYPDAEDAHHAGTAALKTLYPLDLHPRERPSAPGASADPQTSPLAVTVFGTRLTNPLGISAGLDKDAEIPDALFALGPAVVEVGGCTPLPQAGNPRPRVFRVPSADGLVNRYGLNSRGADAMAARLRDRLRRFARSLGLSEGELLDEDAVPPGSLQPGKLLLVQMAKNKATDERDVEAVKRDYVRCVQRLAPYADVLVVNVSSPNTPGLRDLQATEPLTRILTAVVEEAQRTERRRKPKVMVKVSPDEDDDSQMEGVVQAVWMSGVDGVIVGNTTKRRAGLIPQGVRLSGREQKALMEEGGYSGPALFDQTLSLVGRYRKMLDNYSMQPSAGENVDEATAQKVIFATGGITNGEQALKVLNAGASVAMVYTGLVYGGSGTITRMKSEMMNELTHQRV